MLPTSRIALATLGSFLTFLAPTATQAEPALDLELKVDFGKDLGQNFGTLFEGRDPSGRLLYGAGFCSVYNTYYRGERYKLQFFVRPEEANDSYKIEPFPRPNAIPSTYAYDLGDGLYVNHRALSDGLVKYDSGAKEWSQPELETRHGVSVSTVRGKCLENVNDEVVYDGKVIFKSPSQPINRFYYYGQGHLFFYREIKPETGELKKAIVAIPWSPYDDSIGADITKEKTLDLFMPPEFPYAWGQLGDEVLNCSNWGGLYAFDGSAWKVLRKPVENVSYQVYTMLNYGDRLLMGQYPTGFFIEYDGNEVKVLENWPPVPPGASPSARELQTATIYRGELYAGVWPWAELWRLDPDGGEWRNMGRLFKHPQVHADPVHPYEKEAKEAGVVLNQLGQRLTSMVPDREGLVMGTSWKGGETLLDAEKLKSLSQGQREEFGAIHRLTTPGNLSAVIEWKDEPTTLRFALHKGKIAIYQDGKGIATENVEAELPGHLENVSMKWGDGVFGPLRGSLQFQSQR